MQTDTRRVIIVSDTLPVAIVQRENEVSARVGGDSPSERPRRRRRLSLAFQNDTSEVFSSTEEHSPISNLERYELVERPNHAAYWVNAHLGCETVLVGKPFGLEPSEWADNPSLQAEIKERYWHERRCVPVLLSENVHRGHWDGYCRSSLWPLFHYVLWESNIDAGQTGDWDKYLQANAEFCETIMSIWQPNDISNWRWLLLNL
jgi:trehalose-6-phosphate synthase